MNKTFIILLSVLLFSEFIESIPRYGYGSWRQFVRSSEESSEDDSFESCVDCSYTNFGNGHNNHNIVRYNSYPNLKKNQEQTETYQEFEEQSDNETPQHTNNSFGGNGSQRGDGSYNNQIPFRPNSKPIHKKKRPYNDINKRQRSSEIGDFGNGHHNNNIFNIHKKNIYIN